MSKKRFRFEFHGTVDLSVRQVWPGGDAPEDPTTADVIAVIRRGDAIEGPYRDAVDLMVQWDLDECLTLEVDGEEVDFS